MSVKPFKVQIPLEILDDLRDRLARTRWTDQIADAGWDYGTNLTYLKELTEYWQTQFDWRAQEAMLNRFAHFRADVDGFGIHFIHERGKGSNPIPLILTHGWPDSFVRMLKVIPLLTDPASHGGDSSDAFDVIVPSLPGYGFSDRPTERGMSPALIADMWSKLMTQLNYGSFAAHGGDYGSTVTRPLAFSDPDRLIGMHLTDIGWSYPTMNLPNLSEAERQFFHDLQTWSFKEGAYALIQGTKPQTLAFGLNDSPVGLAAWIVEKFRLWSDCEGDVEQRFTKDELLTNLMIYWATQTIHSSVRLYYEDQFDSALLKPGAHSDVPTAVALFPKDIDHPPRELAERFFNVQRWTEMPRGGHFAAMEEPELLVEDIRAFFRSYRTA